jgi:serine/threonine-protein kinase
MEAGEVIGEMALLISSKRTASVVAVEDCELMVVTEETLERELSGMQPWMAALTRTLAARFREREEQSAVPGQASD